MISIIRLGEHNVFYVYRIRYVCIYNKIPKFISGTWHIIINMWPLNCMYKAYETKTP